MLSRTDLSRCPRASTSTTRVGPLSHSFSAPLTRSRAVELGVIIGKGGRDIAASSAMNHVAGYCLAIDYTARNMQEVVKKKGLPWSAVKGFDTFW